MISDRDRRLLREYSRCLWRVELPDGPVWVRLDRPAPPELRGAGIVTGFNPASVQRSPNENRAANGELQRRIEQLGARFFPTIAGEGAWAEPGFAVAIGREAAAALGAEWSQNAIVWFDAAGAGALVVTRSGFCGRRVGDTIAPFTLARTLMLVKDRMTRDPVTVSPDDSLAHALELTRRRRIRHLPVVTGGQRLTGMLSDRDIRSAMPSPLSVPDEQRASFLTGTPVASVMTRNVITVAPNEPIENAARLLHRHRIGALPVLDHRGALLGIVSETDILHTFVEILGGSEPSSRIEVALADEPGELARAMGILGGDLHINVISAVAPSFGAQQRKAAIIHLGTIDPQAAIQALEDAGFEVGWPSLDADLRGMNAE